MPPDYLTRALLIAALVLGLSGLLDDRARPNFHARHRLAAQGVFAFFLVAMLDIRFAGIPILPGITVPLWVSCMISALWIVFVINAFRLVDGVDGLAGGISVIAVVAVAVIAAKTGAVGIIPICVILAGSVAGFLILNTSPARAFLGDAGSLFVGAALGTLSLAVSCSVPGRRSTVIAPLLVALPLVEVAVSIVRRYSTAKDRGLPFGERIRALAVADNAHIHHRLIYRGYSHTQTSLFLCGLAGMFCAGAVALVYASPRTDAYVLLYLGAAIPVVLARLGFGARLRTRLAALVNRLRPAPRTGSVRAAEPDGLARGTLQGAAG